MTIIEVCKNASAATVATGVVVIILKRGWGVGYTQCCVAM